MGAVVLLAALLGSACSGRPLASASPADEAPEQAVAEGDGVVTLRLHQPLVHGSLEIVWSKLEDSRCPLGVHCVWEGVVVVTLEITAEGAEPVPVKLALRPGAESEPVDARDHRFILQDVDPYPREGVTPDPSELTARVRLSVL